MSSPAPILQTCLCCVGETRVRRDVALCWLSTGCFPRVIAARVAQLVALGAGALCSRGQHVKRVPDARSCGGTHCAPPTRCAATHPVEAGQRLHRSRPPAPIIMVGGHRRIHSRLEGQRLTYETWQKAACQSLGHVKKRSWSWQSGRGWHIMLWGLPTKGSYSHTRR